MFYLIEVVDLGQHQITAILAATPVMFNELLGKGADYTGARKRMFDRKVTSVPVGCHHRALNYIVNVGRVTVALDQLLQIRRGLVRADFAGRALVAGLQP
jgi:hypothetical protein